MTSSRRRVLVVTYHYPPSPAVGALRPAKFVKYLPDYGWDPIVLTIGTDHVDPTPHVASVIRTRVWRNAAEAAVAIRRRFQRGTPVAQREPTFDERNSRIETFPMKVKRLTTSLLNFPDGAAGWWGPAVIAGRRLLRETKCDALITTGPPHIAHLVGLALRRPGLRWIADLRDPWVGNPARSHASRSVLSDYFEERAEAAVFRRASAIVTTTERLRQWLVNRYPEAADRVHTIVNGVDLEDFDGARREPLSKFTIAHVGSVYYRRSPGPLFAAVRSLLDAGALPRDGVSLVFAGDTADGIDVTTLARQHGVVDLLQQPGRLSRPDALSLMASAGALLLLAQDQPLQVPAKAFEYIAVGRPIIALTGDGATADTVREHCAGVAVPPEDGDSLKTALLDAYADWKTQLVAGPARRAVDPRLDRQRLAERLSTLLHGSVC